MDWITELAIRLYISFSAYWSGHIPHNGPEIKHYQFDTDDENEAMPSPPFIRKDFRPIPPTRPSTPIEDEEDWESL